MGGAPAPSPMGGASDVPPEDPSMGDDPMGGGPMDGDPNAVGEPGMGGPMDGPNASGMNDGQLDPDMGVDPMAGDEGVEGEDGEEGDDSTMSIIKKLSPEDLKAVRAYAESMLSRDENNGGGEEEPSDGIEGPIDGDSGMGEPGMGGPQNGPMMEANRRARRINENLPVTDLYSKKEKNFNDRRRGNNVSKKSPFNSPKFK